MRSLKAGLIAVAVPSLFITLLVVGCSADGTSDLDPTTEQAPTDPSSDTVIAPDDDGSDNKDTKDAGSKDAGKKDASSKSDAGKDSGPPAPNEGDSCTGATKFTKVCGNCGTQEAYCEADPNSDGGNVGKVGKYSACVEPADACAPGTTSSEACGNCGTVTKTCSNQCKWTSSACNGQPTNSCSPGSVSYPTKCTDTAGNTTGYKSTTCSASCQWQPVSTTCVSPSTPNKMTIASTAGNTVSATFSLGDAMKRPSGDCPATSLGTSAPSVAVEVTNGTNKAATITAYQSQSESAGSKPNMDMVIWTYAGGVLPMDDDAKEACVKGVEDYCDVMVGGTNICGNTGTSNFYFAALDGITIPAGGKILVYSAAFGSSTDIGDKSFKLNLRTDKLQ